MTLLPTIIAIYQWLITSIPQMISAPTVIAFPWPNQNSRPWKLTLLALLARRWSLPYPKVITSLRCKAWSPITHESCRGLLLLTTSLGDLKTPKSRVCHLISHGNILIFSQGRALESSDILLNFKHHSLGEGVNTLFFGGHRICYIS